MGRDLNHSSPSNVDEAKKIVQLYLYSPFMRSWRGTRMFQFLFYIFLKLFPNKLKYLR
jgi:hypothetical protein